MAPAASVLTVDLGHTIEVTRAVSVVRHLFSRPGPSDLWARTSTDEPASFAGQAQHRALTPEPGRPAPFTAECARGQRFVEQEGATMSASDNLAKLSARAKKAEDDAAAAKTQAKADVERTMDSVRASAESEATKLKAQAQNASADAAATWNDLQTSWNAHIAKVRSDVDRRKAQFDAANAADRADWAESDAILAVDYAYSAIEEAEYAVLDAILARREADETAMAVPR
jgi:hypothetical protein